MFEDTLAVTYSCCGDGCRMVVMRLRGAVTGVPRVTTAEVEVDGWVIPPGTVVFLSLASANRDETVYDEPLHFDITAQRPPHLSFGGGMISGPNRLPLAFQRHDPDTARRMVASELTLHGLSNVGHRAV